ncbi:hypothetical protein BE17_52395 [Sorangium cellulosum]|uniref:Uncharacterized protein n=1 Tax=Sorangium cellulosum TaxID=56 RepID=A0A150R7S7_SORCE|nr:hypothetical protein BE17_52395 [Sorangium cellulosum]
MSFLNRIRLAFAGTFQADVSTVNNDVRHFDNATFKSSFQELPEGNSANGWWNPMGSGAFRLLDCRVTGVWYDDGSFTDDPTKDPVVGMLIGGSNDRTSGKMVDLDPQYQVVTMLWGLDVRLTDDEGATSFRGRYQPNAMRDGWGNRNVNAKGDAAGSATFQSVLEGVSWDKGAARSSRFLRELRATTTGDRLSIRMATFGFCDNPDDARYTLGTVVGSIGPYLPGEPSSFVLGRRFTPAANPFCSWNGISFFSGLVDEKSATLFLDLSNALQIVDAVASPHDIGRLSVGILRDPTLRETSPVGPNTFEELAEIPYREIDKNGQTSWLFKTGGVFAVRLTSEQVALIKDHPIALVSRGPLTPDDTGIGLDSRPDVVAIRESDGGLLVCAEPEVHRVDAPGETSTTLYTARYGAPLGGAVLQLAQSGRVPAQQVPPGDPNAPAAEIPDYGWPEEALDFPSSVETLSDGKVEIRITTRPPGNPRKYLDGQIYVISYQYSGETKAVLPFFEHIALHVRDAFEVPADPTWSDIAPIFTQYANLYPLMSKRIVNLSSPSDVKRHASILKLAFSLPITDPNYMPVTRDLSEPKRQMIVKWLEKVERGGDAVLDAAAGAQPAAPARALARAQVKAQAKARDAAQAEAGASTMGGSRPRFPGKFTSTTGGSRLK